MLRKEQEFVFVQRAWDFIGIMQRSCSCALHTDKGDLNESAIDWQVSQKVVAGFVFYILFNLEFNSQFKGDRNHHFDVVSHALCTSQISVQHKSHSISCVKSCKLPLNKGESQL